MEVATKTRAQRCTSCAAMVSVQHLIPDGPRRPPNRTEGGFTTTTGPPGTPLRPRPRPIGVVTRPIGGVHGRGGLRRSCTRARPSRPIRRGGDAFDEPMAALATANTPRPIGI